MTLKLILASAPARAGPTAMPRALALTNAADALVSCFTGTWSEMYRRLIALAPPNLHDGTDQKTIRDLCNSLASHSSFIL